MQLLRRSYDTFYDKIETQVLWMHFNDFRAKGRTSKVHYMAFLEGGPICLGFKRINGGKYSPTLGVLSCLMDLDDSRVIGKAPLSS